MTVEIKGTQLRIRLLSPRKFKKFRTKDVGKKGKLQLIIGIPSNGKSMTQSLRLNLMDFKGVEGVMKAIRALKIKKKLKTLAMKRAKSFFKLRPTSLNFGHAHQWSPRMKFTTIRNNHKHRVNLIKKIALPNKNAKHSHRIL